MECYRRRGTTSLAPTLCVGGPVITQLNSVFFHKLSSKTVRHVQHAIQCENKQQGCESTSSCDPNGAACGTQDAVTRHVGSSEHVDSRDAGGHAAQIDTTLDASMRQDARRLTLTAVLGRVKSGRNTTTHI